MGMHSLVGDDEIRYCVNSEHLIGTVDINTNVRGYFIDEFNWNGAPDASALHSESEAVQEWEEERASWARFSLQMLSYAYGDDEPEYTTDRLIEENPEYEEKHQ